MTTPLRQHFLTVLLYAFVFLFIVASCRSSMDLVLDDPAFLESMVSAALAGEQMRITPEDHPGIRRLLMDEESRRRHAGVLLAVQAKDADLYRDIMDAALDPAEEVSSVALAAIRESSEDYRSFILEKAVDDSPKSRRDALYILGETGGEDLVPFLISSFTDPDAGVRDQASLAVGALASRENPFLREALSDDDETTAAIAIRTLGRYAHPDDAEVFVQSFSSASPEIRKEAQLAAFKLKEAGLPSLHIVASDSQAAYQARLSALEVIQGILSPRSLGVLMDLLSDPDEGMRGKSASILRTYGIEAVSALEKLYIESDIDIRVRALTLMKDIGAPGALPTLAKALDDESDDVVAAARSALETFGSEAWPVLRRHMVQGSPKGQEEALSILRNAKDPQLVADKDGMPAMESLFLLIVTSTSEELEDYLDQGEISQLRSESLLSLQEAWTIAEEFSQIEEDIAGGRDSYLFAWRQRERLAVATRETLQESFALLHEYFETRNPETLVLSQEIREESRRLDEEARLQKEIMDSMDDSMKSRGEARLNRYRELRDVLVRTWEYIVPEFRPLAEAVYGDRGLDPQTLSRESVLLF